MILLDTNVVSELMRIKPDAAVLGWFNQQNSDTLWLNSIVAAELLYGIARLSDGARKQQLARAIMAMLEDDFGNRVAAFDLASASIYATLVADRERAGQAVAMADAQIAAICLAHSATLATRNQKHFANLGVPLIDPWNAG